jgi:hypothetical protein
MEQPTERRSAITTPAPARLIYAPPAYPRPDPALPVQAWVVYAPPDPDAGRAGVLVLQGDALAFLRTNPTRSEVSGDVAALVAEMLREGAVARAQASVTARRVVATLLSSPRGVVRWAEAEAEA